jgi:hypothetical protein
MFIVTTVAIWCALAVGLGLIRLACRHRSDLWIVSEDAILCVVSPVVILLGTFGAVSLGWRITHGGLAAVSTGGWIGSLAIVAVGAGIWRVLAPRIRASGRERAGAAIAPARRAPASGQATNPATVS